MTPLLGRREFQAVVARRLTERQREVLVAAREHGYYDWPRGVTGEELAAALDVSSSTLQKHLRAVERHLVSAFFEEPVPVPEDSPTSSD